MSEPVEARRADTEDLMTPPQWDFALQVYESAGVPDACLLLQEHRGVDVVVLLHAMHAFNAFRIRLHRRTLFAADVHVRTWREEATKPLRAIRIALKAGVAGIAGDSLDAVRQKIKDAELEAEKVEFSMLVPFSAGTVVSTGSTEEVETLLREIVALYLPCSPEVPPADPPVEKAIRTLSRALNRPISSGSEVP